MSRKNTMLGLAALAAFGFAATSFAQCPSGPVPPWTAQSPTLGGNVAIVEGGYDGTSCRLDAQLTQNLGSAAAFVRDETPSDEPSYRAQFIIDADALTGLNFLQSVRVFAAETSAPSNGIPNLVSLSIYGNVSGNQKSLGIGAACAAVPTGHCSSSIALPTGPATIEIALTKGTDGQLRVWVNNGNEASPDVTLDVDNSAWGGVDAATLGLANASQGFRSGQLNRAVGFDEFDSRRQTFIGL